MATVTEAAPATRSDTPQDGRWDQPYSLESGQTQYHELGQVRLWVTLLDKEWQVRSQYLLDQPEPVRWAASVSHVVPGQEVPLQRFVRTDGNHTVRYRPALASLPTVIRPYQPLTIPADGECTIYVGTQVWVQVCAGDLATVLAEIPLSEPSLTWVGPSTMEGELCYTAPSYGRMVLEAVPKRPWRAITPVRVCNRRPEPLLLERFSLPTPLLALYRNDRDQLWTPRVTVVCETEMKSARLKIDSSLVAEAGECQLMTPAREKSNGGGLTRAFDRMFGAAH